MPKNQNVSITILGDICPVDRISPLRVPINEGEVVVGNLECALTDHPVPVKKAGPVLYAPKAFAATLKSWGICAVSLANNHIRDCGDEGVCSTVDACKKNELHTFGAGENDEEAAMPWIVERNGIKVAFISFAEKEFNFVHNGKAGAISFDPYESYDKIRLIRQTVDALIVLYHGGIEHYIYPSPLLKKKCRKMVDAGADVVLCQHSHCIGTHEKYGKGEILYGQGNSYFGYRKGDYMWNHGLLARIEVSSSKVDVHYDVLETNEDGLVELASPHVTEEVLCRLDKESARLSDDAFISSSWKEFCRKNKASYLALALGLGINMNRLNRFLRNGLVRLLYTRRELNVAHNIIRCDAHREVIETILEDYEY